MSQIKSLLRQKINSGLQRKAINNAAKWAERYRVMKDGNNWSFKRHPWLREMHESTKELVVGQKSAQMGYTETALNVTLYRMDVHGDDCLYILPSKSPDATDFSSARFDPALELSPHLKQMFSDTRNVGHKRAGVANLYLRGAQSKSGLKSVPVKFIVVDEADEIADASLTLVQERASGQDEFALFMVSTPTIEGVGINKYYMTSNQKHFFFKCPCCSRFTELVFPDCIVIVGESVADPRIEESHLICKECKGRLSNESKPEWLSTGIWVPQQSDSDIDGFYVNQLYSCAKAVRPANIARAMIRARTSVTDEQELYNSKMGLPHAVSGAKIEDKDILNCIRPHKNMETFDPTHMRTMGVDVGAKVLHVVVAEWYLNKAATMNDLHELSIKKHVAQLELRDSDLGGNAFEEAARLFLQLRCSYAIIDAAPELRESLKFCGRLPGVSRVCRYNHNITGRTLTVNNDPSEPSISANRTAWLDITLGRYKSSKVYLPMDTTEVFKTHIKSLVRTYSVNKQGDHTGQYIKKDNDHDHFAHADNYAEMALPFAFANVASRRIKKDF